MNSLRGRLIVGILSGITLLLGGGGAVAYLKIKERLYSEFNRSLIQRGLSFTDFVELDKGKIDIKRLDKVPVPPGHVKGVDYLHMCVKDGETLVAVGDWMTVPLPRFGGSMDAPEVRELALPDGKRGRGVGIEFHARVDLTKPEKAERIARGETLEPKGPLIQLVFAKVDTVAPTLAGIKGLLFGLWAGCVLLGGIVIWYVVRRSLRPLDQLTTQIGALRDTVSGQRIALRRPPTELQPVASELNRLLERVEAALVRERNLTSNVAHELRTPIAGILSTLEVALSRARPAEEYRESAAECLEIAKRMHWLVSNLLSITRIERGNVQLQHHWVTIEDTLPEWWKPFATCAEGRGIRVAWKLEPGAKLETDPEFLRVVVTNLFDNAVSYTPDGGTIRIEADAAGNISVADQSVDIGADAVEHVFDPFWRKTESRENVGTHAGLGLSLCKKIIELLGGRISARVKESEGLFIVRVELA